MKPPPIRRLFFDIETSPNIVLSWRVGYRLHIDYENLLRERAIICIGYKWEGDKSATVLGWDRNQCDKAILERFSRILARADECVGHNIDRFDFPWIKTRCLFHGLPPLPLAKTVDTLQWARRKFYFNSSRLDYIARFLGIGAKMKTEFKLWKAVLLDKNNGALSTMKRYCAGDVILLEKVYHRLALLNSPKTHAGVLNGHEKWTCPRCASDRVWKKRRMITAKGTEQQAMHCQSCLGYYIISATACKQYEEARRVRAN